MKQTFTAEILENRKLFVSALTFVLIMKENVGTTDMVYCADKAQCIANRLEALKEAPWQK